ncbi:hypothetical protein CcCBS67573_g10048, partial [Chytriomyces confervae]
MTTILHLHPPPPPPPQDKKRRDLQRTTSFPSIPSKMPTIRSNNGQSPLPHPSDPRLLTNLDGGIDWARIARRVHVSNPPISPRDCEIHYTLWGHPNVNNDLFSRDEVFKLAEIGDRIGWMDWRAIAAEMGNGRLPWQCFKLYKKYIDTSSQFWTAEEDAHLRQLVEKHGNNWAIIARSMESRGRLQCQSRWRQNLRPGLSKGKWNSLENQALQDAVQQFGTKNWVSVANAVGTRTEIQCRERYLSVYEPGLLKGKFSAEEIEKLIDLVQVHGTESWSLVAEAMSRTPKMQQNELEALRSIFFDEFSEPEVPTDPPSFHLLVRMDGYYGSGPVPEYSLFVQYTRDYPDTIPIMRIESAVGLNDNDEEEEEGEGEGDEVSHLQRLLVESAESQLGMAMVFGVHAAAKETLETYIVERDERREAERVARIE